jgi:hypothetical protein
MPWKFKTALNPGDLDPQGSYQEAKIIVEKHDSVRQTITLVLGYGATVNKQWSQGHAVPNLPITIQIAGQDYQDLLDLHRELYNNTKAALYTWLRTKGLLPDGDIT